MRSVSGHDRLKSCTSLPDLIAWHLLVENCGRKELADIGAAIVAAEVRNLAREHTGRAMHRLVALMDSKNQRLFSEQQQPSCMTIR